MKPLINTYLYLLLIAGIFILTREGLYWNHWTGTKLVMKASKY